MLHFLGELLTPYFGPFRLFTSYFFLAGLGLAFGGFLSFYFLPKFAYLLPRDRGRAFAVDAKNSQGKPTGAGIIFVSLFLLLALLFIPFDLGIYGILLLTFICCLFGYFDDRSQLAWGEYKKGIIDLLIGISASLLICECTDVPMWLPFTKEIFMVSPVYFVPISTIFIWTAINTTNCTDGVDGLSGTLLILSFLTLGSLHYFVLGHVDVSKYLLVPHEKEGALWGILSAVSVGTLAGYLWHNAHPSKLLMGDAGSRALGFLLGASVMQSGNPFLIFVTSLVLLINGGTGLLKVALLRFTKISIFRSIRFPLHDHVRQKHGWSPAQVLVRFTLIQAMLTLIMITILLKIR